MGKSEGSDYNQVNVLLHMMSLHFYISAHGSAITIIRSKLELDPELHTQTPMKVEHIINLLEFCLKTTYFQFQGRFFEQLQGAAMVSPISPIVANLFMEDFEIKAINSTVDPPRIWKRFVDETFVVINSNRKENFLEHINTMDPYIQFISEDAKPAGSLPFLDTIVLPQPDNSLLTSVYRKPTHTHRLVPAVGQSPPSVTKFSVINTLRHRARTVCSNNQMLKEEEDHLNRVLSNCQYPSWDLNRTKFTNKQNNRTNKYKNHKNSNIKN